MNKKFLTLLTLTFGFFISSRAFAFSDIEGHWAKEAINNAEKMNIITGYSDNTFKPDLPMTRAELVTVINRLLVIESETDKYLPDVTRQDWFHSDIRKAMTVGIIQGDQNGFIHPNDFVTREQAVAIMSRAFCVNDNKSVITNSYLDESDISSWAKSDILNFIKENYIDGYPDNTLRPKANITRAEILSVLNRIISKNVSNLDVDKKLTGNILIREKNIILKNVEIYGDLIIGEGATNTIQLVNCIVEGNLVLYSPIDFEKNIIEVKGDIIKLYDQRITSNVYYSNSVYGINFSLPDGAKAINVNEIKLGNMSNDLVIIDIKQNDEYYFQSIDKISEEEIKNQIYDSIYAKIESGLMGNYPYELYKDNARSNLLVIKRDNIVYTLLFANIVSGNLVDNVMSNIEFVEGEKVPNHDDMIYKNSKLCLKFSYKNGYVGVDDSYNTGVVYNGDAFFKLFIQVNMITDIDEYSIKEVTELLKTLIKSDGKIVEEKISKIYNHDTIQFEIESEDDKIISMYVIVGNNLYNFIFKGDKDKIDSIGKTMFLEMMNSMEF